MNLMVKIATPSLYHSQIRRGYLLIKIVLIKMLEMDTHLKRKIIYHIWKDFPISGKTEVNVYLL